MYYLMRNLPVVGTLGVVALLAGPLARLPIDLGAWLLERWLCGLFRSQGTDLTRRTRDRRDILESHVDSRTVNVYLDK
jgi:hypothetical protein